MSSQKSFHILVVEDDLSHLKTLKTIITSWGYRTTEADDGTMAVQRVRERPYDLILMDILMAEISGI